MRNYSKSTKRYEDGGIVPSEGNTLQQSGAIPEVWSPHPLKPWPMTLESENPIPSDKQMGAAKADLGTLLRTRAKSLSKNK
jgi:hypothetical protein